MAGIKPSLEWSLSLPQTQVIQEWTPDHTGPISIQAGFIRVLLMNLWILDTEKSVCC